MIGIFRTNISTVQDKINVIAAISASFNVHTCSIDTEDCDKVLRIVAGQHPIEENAIIKFVQHMGYQCTVLE
jgi:hypothetical protein